MVPLNTEIRHRIYMYNYDAISKYGIYQKAFDFDFGNNAVMTLSRKLFEEIETLYSVLLVKQGCGRDCIRRIVIFVFRILYSVFCILHSAFCVLYAILCMYLSPDLKRVPLSVLQPVAYHRRQNGTHIQRGI